MTNNDIYKKVTDQIIENLENGVVPWRKPWNEAGLFQPVNFITKKPYRGVNIWLLAHGDTPYWLTFNQVRKLKGKVKKGEKASFNVFWKPIEKRDDDGNIENTYWLFRYNNVFNYSQCENLPAIPATEQADFQPIEKAEQIIQNMPKKPTIEHLQQRAFYSPTHDTINLPKKETFKKEDYYYSTAFHELVHSTGHGKRLNRFTEDGTSFQFGSATYAKEELVAELGASFLCNILHLDQALLENSSAYINSWIARLKNDIKLVVSASSKAQKAVDYILNKQE